MQQIYTRTPMPKCDLNKVALQLYSNRTSAWAFSCKFAAFFQNNFSKGHFWVAASVISMHLQFMLLYYDKNPSLNLLN